MNKTNQSKILWMCIGIITAGMWWYWRESGVPWRKMPNGARFEYAMQPIHREAGEFASFSTCQLNAANEGTQQARWLYWVKDLPWRKLPQCARFQYAMQPIQNEAGKLASLQTYRLIESHRDGMICAPATQEPADRTLVSA